MDLYAIAMTKDNNNCQYCHAEFPDLISLKRHKKLDHTAVQSYPCNVCKKIFKTAYLMRCHRIIHSNENKFKCEKCEKLFRRLPTLKRHEFLHLNDDEKTFVCDICAKRFPAAYLLNTHLLSHNGRHKCTWCDKGFLLKASMNIHILAQHSGNNPYKCEICMKSFSQPSALGRHMKLHNNDTKLYRCDECKKTFHILSYLRKHIIKVHCKPYKCFECKKTFENPNKLDEHQLQQRHNPNYDHLTHNSGNFIITGNKEKRECYICAASFNQNNSYKRHLESCKKAHFDEPNLTEINKYSNSSENDKYVYDNEQLTTLKSDIDSSLISLKTNLNKRICREYKCTKCDKILSSASVLLRHTKIHTRPKHQCSLCGKIFNRSEDLPKHYTNIHNPMKLYRCGICFRTFTHAETLNKHKTIHNSIYLKDMQLVNPKLG